VCLTHESTRIPGENNRLQRKRNSAVRKPDEFGVKTICRKECLIAVRRVATWLRSLPLSTTLLLQHPLDRFAHVGGAFGDFDAGILQGGDFFFGCSFAT